jgi:hypothetical protein
MCHIMNGLCLSCMLFKSVKFRPHNHILFLHKRTNNSFHHMNFSKFTFQHFSPHELSSLGLLTFSW